MTNPDQRSAAAQSYHRWYKYAVWLKRRSLQLATQPLCERCLKVGIVTAANTANHKIPHKGNWTLFITGELESLCASHHSGHVQSEERTGRAKGSDTQGRPTDPRHPWNRA
jgi:5-methylcytosine-specific restriction protein A